MTAWTQISKGGGSSVVLDEVLTTDLVPDENDTRSVGSESRRVEKVWADEIDISGDITGNVTEVLNVKVFGVKGDGVIDDTASLASAASAAITNSKALYIPKGMNVKVTQQLDLFGLQSFLCEGKISTSISPGLGPAIILGLDSGVTTPIRYYINEVSDEASSGEIMVRLAGIKNGLITIHNCPYVQLYADASNPDISSISYSSFFLGKVDKLELWGEDGISWITENAFYGGRIEELVIDSLNFRHNHNQFFFPRVEGSATRIYMNRARYNTIWGYRGESNPTIEFGPESEHNVVIGNFQTNADTEEPLGNIVDNGYENLVLNQMFDVFLKPVSVWQIDPNSIITDGTSEWNMESGVVTSGIDALEISAGFADLIDVIIPVDLVKRFDFLSDADVWRFTVQGFDENGNLIDPTVTPFMSTFMGWNTSSTEYSFSSNQTEAHMHFFGDTVKKARINIRTGGGGVVGTTFQYAKLEAYYQPRTQTRAIEQIQKILKNGGLFQSSAPTEGNVPLGTLVGTSSGMVQVSFRKEANLTASATSGATTVSFDTAGVAVGDVIGIVTDDGSTFWTTVSVVDSGTQVTLNDPLDDAASSGNRLVVLRWTSV